MKKAAKWLLCINLLAWTLLAVQVLTVNMEQRVAQNTVPVQNGDVQAKGEDADAVKKKVALTFDDGPDPDYTEMLLDGLKKRNVKATFFVVGKEDEASAAIYQRIVDEGHTLGMHSYSNKYSLIYQSEDAFEADFHQLQDYLYEVTGEKSRYYRFPGGSSNQISNVPMSSLIRFLNSEDVVYYDWNVSAGAVLHLFQFVSLLFVGHCLRCDSVGYRCINACRPFHRFWRVRLEDKPDEPGAKQGEECHHAIEFQLVSNLAV